MNNAPKIIVIDNENRRTRLRDYLVHLGLSDVQYFSYWSEFAFGNQQRNFTTQEIFEESLSQLKSFTAPVLLVVHINTPPFPNYIGGGKGDICERIIKALIREALPDMKLIIYSGGNESNFNALDRRNNPALAFSTSVGSENIATKLGSIIAQSLSLVQPDSNSITVTAPVITISTDDDALIKLRRDISHDDFKNAFCNALGFHASDANSPHRTELLLRAGQDERTWLLLKPAAELWFRTPDKSQFGIADKLKALLGKTENNNHFSRPKPEYLTLCTDLQKALTNIDCVLTKFTRLDFSDAQLTPDEVGRFWLAADCISTWLGSINLENSETFAQYFNSPNPPPNEDE